MSTTYELYDADDNVLLQTAEYSEIKAHIIKTRPDGYSVWDGQIDDDGEFAANQRLTFMTPSYDLSDDPRVAELVGQHVPEDTDSLGDPWWKTR
ncbi:hypothetical protein G6L37_01610 [Agrobacterium rubi]|nr:hypothetical protein [Agrobacterium rubi]NTF24090.1 hypothetical protein [Agrobacterium rubi]